ncbi:unnamed protein product [Phytophthora fragariaefolia]|uniref:Unnamed protein product n=1 Tax=Phytophthora fragariaefolia TaxID=1490495 RepID=A0A9W6X3V0_9STRA|nr:unnamed protein product [Phytophthora fragariaefolia]
MAKRIRVTKQDAAVPAPTGLADAAKTPPAQPAAVPKGKTATPTNPEGKHVMLPAFLSKTYEIFSMPEFSHVCGWNANGDTIIVSQLEAFVALVLPRFFKHRNFPSFVRQLNLYGFHKTVLDSKRLEFQHPFFKRGRPDLLHNIKRKVSSSNHHNQQLVSSSIQVRGLTMDDGLKGRSEREPSSVVEVPNAVEDANPFAMTVPSSPLSAVHQDAAPNNVLSIFSPINAVNNSVPSIDQTVGGFLTNGAESAPSVPAASVPSPTVETPTATTPTVSTPTVSTPTVATPGARNGSQAPSESAATSDSTSADSAVSANSNNQLAFLDEELPLLPDSDHYNFTDGEQQAVMKKLEDFETSLLDEYDVSCLDTLLQQLKNSNGDKPAGVSVADPEEVAVGPTNTSPHDA